MNAWQLLLQLRSLLRAETWDDTPNEVVFGTVRVSAGLSDEAMGELRFPLVLLTPGQATADDSEDELLTQEVAVQLAVRVSSDPFGEAALIGGPQDTQGSSDGRGLMEVEEKLLDVVGEIDGTDGVTIRCDHRSAVRVAQDEELGAVVHREYLLSAWVTADRSYPGVLGL